jgi:hypothetical protein
VHIPDGAVPRNPVKRRPHGRRHGSHPIPALLIRIPGPTDRSIGRPRRPLEVEVSKPKLGDRGDTPARTVYDIQQLS